MLARLFIGLVAYTATCVSAHAACRPGESLVFECLTQKKNNHVSVCLSGDEAVYRFGEPGQAPELTLSGRVAELPHHVWPGAGRYINEWITFRNGEFTYTAGYSVDRLHPSCTTECDKSASLRVDKSQNLLAELHCQPETVEHGFELLAAPPRQSKPCSEAVTTVDMVRCEQEAADALAEELKQTYKALLGSLDADGKKLLQSAQKSWRGFRKRECAFVADGARGGSMAPLLQLGCFAQLTQQRLETLRAYATPN